MQETSLVEPSDKFHASFKATLGLLTLLMALAPFPLAAHGESARSANESASAVTVNAPDDGYRGIWYMNQPSYDEYVYKYSGGLGTYCAKHKPFAVYCDKVKKTFFCYGGTTKDNNSKLLHMVSYYDHNTGMVPRPTILLDKKTGDAHDNPVISLDDKGHIWVFSTSHGTVRPSYIHRSQKPYDVSKFELVNATKMEDLEEVPMSNFSYMQAWHIKDKGFICFFTRYGYPAARTIYFMRSRDGVEWPIRVCLAAIDEGHYQISTVAKNKAGTAFNFHPKEKGLNWRTNLYYIETTDFGRTWQSADGRKLLLPLRSVKNPVLVHDYQAQRLKVYLKDIRFDNEGRPVILFLTSKGYEAGPKNDPRTWTTARWTGRKWQIRPAFVSDNNYDMGSLYIENDGTWRIIAPTETGPQTYNPGGEMAMWISKDLGKTWKKVKQLTKGSLYNHTYARRPVNAHPDFYAFWADGHGRKPSKSHLYFCDKEGKVWLLPREMTKDFVKPTLASKDVTRREAMMALRKAVRFFHTNVASHGGYLWRYSADLTLREGEGKATETMIWVQPPGTPSIGQVYLDAHEATGEQLYLDAACDAASALLQGQLRTGGWFYHIEFDPVKRQRYGYRDVPKRKGQRQKTTLDDNTTQSAVRFLMRLDKLLQFRDQKIHEAVTYALEAMLRAQFPNGGWYQWWDRYPNPASVEDYPVKAAGYPETWSRIWPNDWTGCYFINDNVMMDMVTTMLDANKIYGKERYLESALKAGDFLILSQMPEPQPAWAQQYDRNMHPVWDRKFEPPAITGGESQAVLETLMLLYQETGKKKYLAPIHRAISYLRKSQLPDGRLARFYELKTNKPLYFTREYKLTYSSNDTPTHYSFIVDSRLDSIEAQHKHLLEAEPTDKRTRSGAKMERMSPKLVAEVREIINSMDERGAWVQHGQLRSHKVEPESGIIDCRTFINNVRTLCRFLVADR